MIIGIVETFGERQALQHLDVRVDRSVLDAVLAKRTPGPPIGHYGSDTPALSVLMATMGVQAAAMSQRVRA